VAEVVKPPLPVGKEIRPLSPEQARTLLKEAHGDRLEALYVLAVTTGMRQGELLGLKWEDVDLQARTLRVRRTLSTATGRGFSFSAPKTAKGRRSIKLPATAVSSLSNHRDAQLEERDRLAGLWQDHDLLFTTQVGTPYLARTSSPAPSSRSCSVQTCQTYVSTIYGIPAPHYC
jgi:integrase